MIEAIGEKTLKMIETSGEATRLVYETLRGFVWQIRNFRFRYRETVEQMYSVAVQSLPVVVCSLTFISLMMTVEFSYHMKMVIRQDTLVPAFSTMLIIRELGPVITCLLFT